MSINLTELKALLKLTTIPVFRNKAPDGQGLPYIVYTFISEGNKRASGIIYKRLPLFQISLFTKGPEEEFHAITNLLDRKKIPFSTVMSTQGDENDDTVTNIYTNVRCIEDVE